MARACGARGVMIERRRILVPPARGARVEADRTVFRLRWKRADAKPGMEYHDIYRRAVSECAIRKVRLGIGIRDASKSTSNSKIR